MDGCLSFTKFSEDYFHLELAPYNPTTPSQQWTIDKSGRIKESRTLMCLYPESSFNMGNIIETPMALGANRGCIYWSFVPIFNGSNQHNVCTDFKERKSYVPVRKSYNYYNPPVY